MLPVNWLLVSDRNSSEMAMSSPAKLIEFLRVQRVESSLRRKTGTVVAEREHGDGTCETIVREEQKLQRWLRIEIPEGITPG
jgi:hypothetical protein